MAGRWAVAPASGSTKSSEYLGRVLEGLPVTTGDRVRATLIGGQYREFTVAESAPGGVVLIGPKTMISVQGEGLASRPEKSGITYEDVSDAFFGAFTEELKSQSVRQWLADIVLEFNEEARGGGGEVGESRRRPMVRAIHGYNIYVTYPNEKFARKHESVIGHIIQKSLVKQYAIRDGYSMEYGPIDKDDYRRLEGIIYSKLGNAVRVGLVQVAYAGGSGRDASEAGAGTKNFIAVEFDLSRGERTDKRMDFIAVDLKDAAEKLAYTLNLSSSGWRVSPSGRTVNRKTGNIGWHIVEAGSSAARNMGVSENNHRPLVRDYIAVDPKGRPVAGPFTDYDKAKREADRARGYVRFASRAHERSRRPTRRRPSR